MIREHCAPLLERRGEEFLVAASAQTLASVLQDHMSEKSLTNEKFFEQMNGGKSDGGLDEQAFVAYLATLPEALSREELTFSQERRKAIFHHADSNRDGVVDFADFLALLRMKYVCVQDISVTDVFDVAQSKTVSKIEVGDIAEALGNAKKDEVTGMTRVQCKVLSNDKVGWVTVQGRQGKTYLEVSNKYRDFIQDIEAKLAAAAKTAAKVNTFATTKAQELASRGPGPLQDARLSLSKMRPATQDAMSAVEQLKKKVTTAARDHLKKVEVEAHAHIEAREQREADALLAVARERLAKVDCDAKKLEEAAKPLLSAADPDKFPTPLTVQESCETLSATVTQSLSEAKASIREQQEKLANWSKGPMFEAKRDLAQMSAKVENASKMCAKSINGVIAACKAVAKARCSEASALLREEAKKRNMTKEKLFKELAKGDRLVESDLCELLKLSPEHGRLLCRHVDPNGIGERKFYQLIQQYYVVVKEIAVTPEFEVGKCKTLRRVGLDEIFEVLEGPRSDEKLGLTRIRGRSLNDGVVGWISVSGNKGTPFLKEVAKPYYAFKTPTVLELEGGEAEDVRTLKVDEGFELLEGPQKETFNDAQRVKCKVSADGATGWLTIQDSNGVVYAKPSDKYMVCCTSIAMTDVQDMKVCKVLKRLVVGEVFLALDEMVEEADAGVTRVRAKCLEDGKEGFITVQGNAGTKYAEGSSKHYSVVKTVPLQTGAKSVSESVRELEEGEAIEILQGPTAEKFEPLLRVKGRALSDDAVGWVTLKGDNWKSWSPYYRVLKPTSVRETPDAGATVVRDLEKGETVEYMEGPVEDVAEEVCIKGRAETDGTVGWITLRDASGTKHLDS